MKSKRCFTPPTWHSFSNSLFLFLGYYCLILLFISWAPVLTKSRSLIRLLELELQELGHVLFLALRSVIQWMEKGQVLTFWDGSILAGIPLPSNFPCCSSPWIEGIWPWHNMAQLFSWKACSRSLARPLSEPTAATPPQESIPLVDGPEEASHLQRDLFLFQDLRPWHVGSGWPGGAGILCRHRSPSGSSYGPAGGYPKRGNPKWRLPGANGTSPRGSSPQLSSARHRSSHHCTATGSGCKGALSDISALVDTFSPSPSSFCISCRQPACCVAWRFQVSASLHLPAGRISNRSVAQCVAVDIKAWHNIFLTCRSSNNTHNIA